MSRTVLARLLACLLVAGSASACLVQARRGYVVAVMPPPLHVEWVAPRTGHVWVRGNWAWIDQQWAWQDGHWVKERPGYLWIQGDWVQAGDRFRWQPGYWRATETESPRYPVIR
jgi:YXWGXW repeat-containing protein